jgi:hypothetical protein
MTTMTMKNGARGFVLATSLAMAFAAVVASGRAAAQATYATPQEAMQAVAAIAGSGDAQKANEVFGPKSDDLLHSGDDVADRQDGLRVKELIGEKVVFEDSRAGGKVALIGKDGWPFPIPLVNENGRWRFDLNAGREELANRRVGRNELSTMTTMHAYVAAQREYFAAKYAGKRAYAARLFSSDGKHDGLYWPVPENVARKSPLGPLVAAAAAEGYKTHNDPPEPFRGYYFRILTAQGKSAPGGDRSYIDDKGALTKGFALLAWPAKYGNSGVMTFQINRQGIVFQKDLGPSTEAAAAAITRYDPDETWTPTDDGF